MLPTRPWASRVGKSFIWSWQHLLLSHDEVESKGLLFSRGSVSGLLWRCRIGKPYTRPWRHLVLGNDEAGSEGLLGDRDDISDLAMRVSSHKPFYSAAAMHLTWPWRSRVRRSSSWLRRRCLQLAVRCHDRRPSTRPRQLLLLGHDEAESKGLVLGCGDVFHLAMTTSNRKAFYSSIAMPLTRLRRSRVGKPSIGLRQRRLLLGHDEAESTSPIWPWSCWVAKPSTRLWRRLLLGHEEAESEGLLLGLRRRLQLGGDGVKSGTLTLGCSDVSYSAITMPSSKVVYSAAAASLTWWWRCQVGNPSTRPRRCLLLGHDKFESKGLLLGRSDESDLAMMMPTRKGFYSTAATSLI